MPALLEEKLKAEGPKTIYYVLAAYSAPSEERKKLLLRAAKIDNNESANFAVIALDELLSREQIQAKRKSSAVKVDVAIDPKIVDVTKKIFSQYDSNGSKSLDAAEWSKMKVDPSQADSDANGEITVREYAE